MDEIRSWWEVPCVAHFCHIFRRPFKLPDFDIEELEDAVLLDYAPSPSQLLVELYCKFLNGIVDKHITDENWEFFLKLHVEWRCEYLSDKWNPFVKEKQYKDLTMRERILILHKLCHWRLELDDIADLLRGMDGPSLRLESVGKDVDGNVYWYFFGTRLYREEKKRRRKKETDTPTTTPGKKGRGKVTPANRGRNTGKSRSARRRRGTQEDAELSTSESKRATKSGRRSNTFEENGIDNCDSGSSDDQESEVKGQNGSPAMDGKVNGNDYKKSNTSVTGWSVVCSSVEEWSELIDSFESTRHQETKRLRRNLQELLPEVEHLVVQREKELKRKLLAEIPRRTSDRIALKAQQQLEEERLEAVAREMQREELRRLQAEEEKEKQEELEKKRQRKREEALERRKAKEEAQQKQREEEDENWEKALSGELSGRRKAAIGAAENVSEDQLISRQFQLVEGRDEDLYTAMYKILAGLRGQEDAWVFEDPVTESIAPGYFEVIDTLMDYTTVEKKLEANQYRSKEEFAADIQLIYENCIEYNGDENEYSELAKETTKTFQLLFKQHIEGEVPIDEEGTSGKSKRGRKGRESRSPSACKTPELTSESSSDEEESDDSDESFTMGGKSSKKMKGKALKLPPGLEKKMGAMSTGHFQMPPHGMSHPRPPPGMFPPHMPPQYYHHYMQQQQRMRMQHPEMRFRPPQGMPPPYPGQPHSGDLLARHHGMYPAHPSDGRHMYPNPNYTHHPSYPPHYHMHQQQLAAYHQHRPHMPGIPHVPRPPGSPVMGQRQTASPTRHSSSPGISSPPLQTKETPTESTGVAQSTSTADKSSPTKTDAHEGQRTTNTPVGQPANEGESSEVKVQMNSSNMTPEMIQQQQYRYQQMIAMQHRHGSYGYGPQAPPPGYNPSQRPRMDMSEYYAWHQMGYRAPPDVRPGHFDAHHQQQQYWKELELRRRQHYMAAAMNRHRENKGEGGSAESAKLSNEQLYWRELEMRRRQHYAAAAMMKQQEAERIRLRTKDGDADSAKMADDSQLNRQQNEAVVSQQKTEDPSSKGDELSNEEVPDKQHSNDGDHGNQIYTSNQDTSGKGKQSPAAEDSITKVETSNNNLPDAAIPPTPETTPPTKPEATPTPRPHPRGGFPPYPAHHMMSNGYPPMPPDYMYQYHQPQQMDPMMSSGGSYPSQQGGYYPAPPRIPYYPSMRAPHVPYLPHDTSSAYGRAPPMLREHMRSLSREAMKSVPGEQLRGNDDGQQTAVSSEGKTEESSNPVDNSQHISDNEEPPPKRPRIEQ